MNARMAVAIALAGSGLFSAGANQSMGQRALRNGALAVRLLA